MIKARYNRQYHMLTVEGHAGSAEEGHDLVCASCSILIHTLAANVLSWEDAGQVIDATVTMRKGYALLSCCPKTRYKALLTLVMDAICGGFELLANEYPEYIEYTRLG